MTLNSIVEKILINASKNAVNAALTALGPVATWHYHLTNAKDLKHVLVIMGSAIVAREALVYVPKILAWSTTSNGGGQS